jgi:hypothetical protein
MNAIERNLLTRIARRLEEQADAAWRVTVTAANDTKSLDAAKRRRDRELGDAKDLREFVKRAEQSETSERAA